MDPTTQVIVTGSPQTLEILLGVIVNNSRISDLRSHMEIRFDSMQKHMDARFDAMDARLKHWKERVR